MSTFYLGTSRTRTVENEVQYLDKKFRSLVDKANQEVCRQMEPSVFLFRVTNLPILARLQHRTFIEEKLTNIPPPVTFENVWTKLNLYWDFLNYGFLEHVIDTFGSADLKQQMRNYVNELAIFKQKTLFCDLCDFIGDDRSLDEGLKSIVVKIRKEWSQCTLHDVELFKKDLVHKFFLPEFAMILQKAERGCVCVTWLTSPSIATLLQQNLANIETEFFKKHGINAMTIELQESEKPSVGTFPEKLRSFKPDTSEEEILTQERPRKHHPVS